MNSVLTTVRSLMQMFDAKAQAFISEIDNVHMVWLEEIKQEADRMFTKDFNTEPELMPKTPSQKKKTRRKRVSVGRQEENQGRRRFSKGRRSNLRGSSVKSLNFIAEEKTVPEASTSETSSTTQPKRTTRKNKQAKPEVAEDVSQCEPSGKGKEVKVKKSELVEEAETEKDDEGNVKPDGALPQSPSPPPSLEPVVIISPKERLSAELAEKSALSPGRIAAKIQIAGTSQNSRHSSVRCSLKLRRSLAGLRHSMTQESVRRASRRSMIKRQAARMGTSTCSSNLGDDSSKEEEEVVPDEASADTVDNAMPDEASADTVDNAMPDEASADNVDNAMPDEASADNVDNAMPADTVVESTPEISPQLLCPSVGRVTRSVAANSPALAPPACLFSNESKMSTTDNRKVVAEMQQTSQSAQRPCRSTKRKAPDTVEESPTKRFSPPKKSQSAIRPNMKSFLHTVHKNQLLMMTPNSLGRTAVIRSFIKNTTPLKVDPKLDGGIVAKERSKLEALKKKQEQEQERMKKMEEEKKKKQEELKRKRDERLRRVFEAKVKEEQKEEEKKKKIEQKMAQFGEKNEKRLEDEKTKKRLAVKRQEELEQKKKLEEEAKKKKQAEEEKRQQELLAKKKAEEEEELRKLAEARKALELKREQERERERELERERQAAAERERVKKEKALALQRELERAARQKEMRDLEEKRKALEEKRKLEEKQRLAAKEKAAKELEAAKQREASTKQTACLNVTMEMERSAMSTPVGKGGGLNVTVDIEPTSPQSYVITPKGGNKPSIMSKNSEDYGMDQNSDDSTDDESAPRKPIPSWAEGPNLQQIIMKQYFNPPDLDSFFGVIEPPKLENIFYKSKPRYFKRTSSAVWHSPPTGTM